MKARCTIGEMAGIILRGNLRDRIVGYHFTTPLEGITCIALEHWIGSLGVLMSKKIDALRKINLGIRVGM